MSMVTIDSSNVYVLYGYIILLYFPELWPQSGEQETVLFMYNRLRKQTEVSLLY